MKNTNKLGAQAMAFYHEDGLPAAWKQAAKFAGKGGRLATMPDIVTARLDSTLNDTPWCTYSTTTTAEYYGFSKTGKRILIVAHDVGPMSTLDGVMKAYSWHYKDKNRDRKGGRITEQEFWDLEAGKYGEVSVIDLEAYCKRYEYPFLQVLRFSEALTDPLLHARLGHQAEDYVKYHAEEARKWHREQAGLDPENRYQLPNHEEYLGRRRNQHVRDGAEYSNPYIITMGGPSNLCYFFGWPPKWPGFREIESGMAVGHLISTGALAHLHHEQNESLVNDVGCHEWSNGVRLVGIKAGGDIRTGLHKGPSAHDLLRQHWQDLFFPVEQKMDIGFRALMKINNQWFTQYLKDGERMDAWEPEFIVTSMEKIGEPTLFQTTIGGYHGFFKYGIKEVEAIAPQNANAYSFASEPQISGEHHIATVQFYRITADTTKRLMKADKLAHDFDLLMKLVEKKLVTA
jgi:hypothetical protein